MLWNSRGGERGKKLFGEVVMGIKHLQALPIMEEGVDRLPKTTSFGGWRTPNTPPECDGSSHMFVCF